MSTTNRSTDTRRLIASYCLPALALVFATNPLTHVLGAMEPHRSHAAIAWSGFLAPVHMLLMVGSVLAITQILRGTADRRGLVGGALAIMGWTAGARILALIQLDRVLQGGVEGVPANALSRILEKAPIVFASLFPPGLMFPIGMIILGVTLSAARPFHRGIGALLAIGGLLFPVGRIGDQWWAWLGSDLSLAAAFALIGWQLLTRPELWHRETAAHRAEGAHLATSYAAAAAEVRAG